MIFAVDILTTTRDEGFGVLATVAEACWDGGVNTVCPLEVELGIKQSPLALAIVGAALCGRWLEFFCHHHRRSCRRRRDDEKLTPVEKPEQPRLELGAGFLAVAATTQKKVTSVYCFLPPTKWSSRR